jgi:hypothetical protein
MADYLENLTKPKPAVLEAASSEDSFDMDFTLFQSLVDKEQTLKELAKERKR